MQEVDVDQSGTIDFYEFLLVFRIMSKGEGKSQGEAPLRK